MKYKPLAPARSKRPETTRYLIESVLRACNLLKAFRGEGEALRLRDLAERTGVPVPTTLRLLRTLERGGLIEKVDARHYRPLVSTRARRRFRFGYVVDTAGRPFRQEVTRGIVNAGADQGVETIVYDNHGDRRTALHNAELLIKAKVDVVIDFHTDHVVGPAVAERYMAARIPIIAIDVPHPGATFFGVNNYPAGRLGGRFLARWVKKNWDGHIDHTLLIGAQSVVTVASRLRGALAGLEDILPASSTAQVCDLETGTSYDQVLEAVRRYLHHNRARRIAILCPTDPAAMGGLAALEEAGRGTDGVVLGFSGSHEARTELRRPGSRLAGCVAFFPERYGEKLVPLALRIVEGKQVPPAVFIEHQVLTRKNVDLIYPNEMFAPPALHSSDASVS